MGGFGNGRDVFGQEIPVLYRLDRVFSPHHRADLIHPITTRVHRDFTGDIALGRVHRPVVILMLRQSGDGRVAIDLGPGQTGAACQGLTQLRRVDVAV